MTNKIILVSIDSLRFDCIGYQPEKNELIKYNSLNLLETPNLDEIAKKSVCFTHAISVSTYTTSAHASILTGLYPPKHGVRAFYDTKLSKNVFSLAEIFKNAGYITILATDIIDLFKPLDLTRGFSYVFEKQDNKLYDFLNKNKDKKLFILIHFFDIHEPYLFSDYEIYPGYNSDYYEMIDILSNKNNIQLNISTEQPYEIWNYVRKKIAKNIQCFLPYYVKGVTKFDKGRFKEFMNTIQSMGLLNDSLLIIFADHGEGKCDEANQYLFSHGGFPYENVIRIPLMVYNEGIKPKIIDTQVSIIDLFPTVLNMAMNKIPQELLTYTIEGKDLISIGNADNHDFVQGEGWICPSSDFYATDIGLKTPKDENIEWFHSYRFLRRKDKKYVIYGNHEAFLDVSVFNLPNEEFIRKLYRCLLGRIEDKQGFEHWLKNLNLNILSKNEVLTSFLHSQEYQLKRKFAIFDLENDPMELNPIDPLKNPLHAIDFFKNLDVILTLEKQAVSSEKIFGDNRKEQTPEETSSEAAPGDKAKATYSKEDEKKIKERLKSLGYLG